MLQAINCLGVGHHLLGCQKSTIPSGASHLLRRPPPRVICWLQRVRASILPTPTNTHARLMKTENCEPHLTGRHFYHIGWCLESFGRGFLFDFGLWTFEQHFGCMFITKHPHIQTRSFFFAMCHLLFFLQTYPRNLYDCDISDEDVDGGDLASCLDNAGRELVVLL